MLLCGATAHVQLWTASILGPHPLDGKVLNFFNADAVILGQPFVAHVPAKPLDMCVMPVAAGQAALRDKKTVAARLP